MTIEEPKGYDTNVKDDGDESDNERRSITSQDETRPSETKSIDTMPNQLKPPAPFYVQWW